MFMSGIIGVISLGVIQGLTEFLPVSSSGHLVIGSHLFKLAEPSLLFDIVLHVGTLIPVLWLYRSDLIKMIVSLGSLRKVKENWDHDSGLRLTVCVVVGTIPTGIIGVLARDFFEKLFSSPTAVGIALLITGVILMSTRLRKNIALDPENGFRSLTLFNAFVVGLAQGIAITPGISRSGTTISTALLLGIERDTAAKFSFLLAIPAIIGAVILEIHKADMALWHNSFIFGVLAATITGYIALRLVVRFVRQGTIYGFAFYLWPLGISVLIYTLYF